MFGGHRKKGADPALEPLRILLPEQIVQEHAHGVHSKSFRPSEFLVDLWQVEGLLLPHFQFVDGVGWNVIAPNWPRLLLIPRICSLLGPPRGLCGRLRK